MSDESRLYTRRGLQLAYDKITQLERDLAAIESTIALQAETGGNAWHDNAGYEEAVRQVDVLNTRVNEAHEAVRWATVVDLPKSAEVVAIGTRVKINNNGSTQLWGIVGFGETDIDQDLISYNTPLASLLVGCAVGDETNGTIGKREVKIKILEISLLGEIAPVAT